MGLRDALGRAVTVRTTTLADRHQGLADSVLDDTDVLLWWSHTAHDDLSDERADQVVRRVHKGMGFVALHSAVHCKPFRALMGTPCNFIWREGNDSEHLWVITPTHPVAHSLGAGFTIPKEEMYGEYFDIPTPDEVVFLSGFTGGEVFRSGCCFHRGFGRIFYFRPGHETSLLSTRGHSGPSQCS